MLRADIGYLAVLQTVTSLAENCSSVFAPSYLLLAKIMFNIILLISYLYSLVYTDDIENVTIIYFTFLWSFYA